MSKYLEQYGYIEGVENESTVFSDMFDDVQILVTKGKIDKYKEQYFNVYFIDPVFRTEPMNNLHKQIPIENEPKDWERYLKIEFIAYIAWRDFNLEGCFIVNE